MRDGTHEERLLGSISFLIRRRLCQEALCTYLGNTSLSNGPYTFPLKKALYRVPYPGTLHTNFHSLTQI